MRVAASLHALPRVGFIVPRHKHSAVDRNRLKRRLRELARTELLPMLSTLTPLDVVLRAHPNAYDQRWDALQREVRYAMRKLRAMHDGGAKPGVAAAESPDVR